MTTERRDGESVQVRGTWPLAKLDATGRPMWYVTGTQPPQYAHDAALEAQWRAGQREDRTMQLTTLQGDCREILPTLPAQSVQMEMFA